MTGHAAESGHRRTRSNCGSVMLALIAALTIMAVLAVAIIPLVSSSGQQNVAANLASRAYLLAESGFRYAITQYDNSGPTQSERNDVLETLDGNYTLDDGQGSFTLTLNSFFYEITADANGTTPSIITRSPGTFAFNEIDLNNSLRLSIDNNVYEILGFTKSGDSEDGNVTFTINSPGNGISAGSIALPAVASIATSQTLTNGGNLYYETGGGGMFPLDNGRIRVGYRTLTYRHNDRTNHQFVDVRDSADPAMGSYSVAAGTPITLDVYARLHSTGVVGSGSIETSREVVYYDIISQSGVWRREFMEKFENQADTAANWTSASGSHEVGVVGSEDNQGLMVIAAPEGKSLITLQVTTLQDLFNTTRRSTGGYLSYDVQTKVGYYDNVANPPSAYFPDAPIPARVAAGLSFRLSPSGSSFNGYGLSFMRAGPLEDPPLAIAPVQDKRLIILWRQTNHGQDFQWLAYKDISEKILMETGFEDGWSAAEWTYTDPAWQRTTERAYPGGSYSFFYNKQDASTCTLTFQGENGNGFTLPAGERICLRFQTWFSTEHPWLNLRQVQIRVVGDGEWHLLSNNLWPKYLSDDWSTVEFPLTGYAGQPVQFRFRIQPRFDDARLNETWYIDNVQIVSDAWPIMDSTLVVRLKEAALLSFSNGSHAPIQQGARVYGANSGALGTVIVPPILSGGDFGNDDAQGVLLLNNVTSTSAFSAGETIQIIDSSATAEVTSFDNAVDRKVNVIKVYYADPDGFGTPDNTSLDADTQGYSRLTGDETLQWPTAEGGNWTTEQDFFRLIQWDVVNDANVTDLAVIPSLAEPGAIVRHHDPDFQSPQMGTTLNQPELGLHSHGDGAANVYFDDFGVQVYIRQDNTLPLQQ